MMLGGAKMSFRAIELQVALPRSQDVGKIQDQLQQRGQVSQDQLAHDQKKLDELRKHQVSKFEESEESKLERERQEQKQRERAMQQHKKKQKKAEVVQETHPYKGKFVDFSG